MKRLLFSAFSAFRAGLAAACESVLFLIGAVFDAVFPLSTEPHGERQHTERVEFSNRQSQTGNGVWAFVTNLFSVEGRTYTWRAGAIG